MNNVDPARGMSKHKGHLSFAAVLLGLMIVVTCRHVFPEYLPVFLMILQSGFEAGTVGGAADWLAVKMIFDEIRIGKWKIVPASGIIPRKQAAIAQGAGNLVANEWLTPRSIQDMLRQLDVAGFLASYLESWRRSGEWKKTAGWLLENVTSWLDQPATREKLAAVSREFLGRVRVSQWLAREGSENDVRQFLNPLVPYLCDKLAGLLTTPAAFDLIHARLVEEQDSFFKKILFDPVEATEKTILKVTALLREMQFDETHPIRLKISSGVADWIQRLRESETEAASLDQFASGVLEAVPVENWVSRLVDQLRDHLPPKGPDDESPLESVIGHWIDETVVRLRSDASWKSGLNDRFIAATGELLAQHHQKIAELVADNIRRLSPAEIREQFRSRTYDDMQWIRVNGAVAGFVIGLGIGLVRWALGG